MYPQFTPISFTYKKYQVKTVSNSIEKKQALALRHKVFKQEMCGEQNQGMDTDAYDLFADILIIKDVENEKVIGTYRLISSQMTNNFYSANEFAIEDFLRLEGEKLELGRACIDPEYRNGIVLGLLWRGITSYVKASGARYLFGCSTLWTNKPEVAKGVIQQLDSQGHVQRNSKIKPTSKYKIKNFESAVSLEEEDLSSEISLLKVYLKAGAKGYAEPAYDKAFDCIDLFTVLDFDKLNLNYKRKYS